MKLQSFLENTATITINSQSIATEPYSLSDTNALVSSLGMDIELIGVQSKGEGEIQLDLKSGWPQKGQLDIESNGTANIQFSSDWIEIMRYSSNKSASEIDDSLEKLKNNPFSGEVTFEFRIQD